MATEPIVVTVLNVSGLRQDTAGSRVLSDYWALTKPEVNFLIALTAAVGFYLGSTGSHFSWTLFLHTLLGTLLVASGAATLNQRMEYRFDAEMRRTARRPVAAGRIEPIHALIFGTLLSLLGVAYLAFTVNVLATGLALLTLVSYLLLYTPSKRITPLCTLIGAFPGAIPPLIGCAAAQGHLDAKAWALFAIVFFWQFPHFMAIAWMYRDDYDRAGYMVLPRRGARAYLVNAQTVLPLVALVPVTFLTGWPGHPDSPYCIGAALLSLGFLAHGVHFVFRRSNLTARRLLMASIIYLPALFAGLVLSNC